MLGWLQNGLSLASLMLIATVVLADESLSGHRVIRILTQSEEDVTLLQNILSLKDNLDIWKEPSCPTCGADVRLSPLEYDDITSVLNKNGFRTVTLIEDVQKLIDSQRQAEDTADLGDSFNYSKYHQLNDIYSWVSEAGNTYPNLVTIFNVTNSYEGRPLMGIKISSPSTTNTSKPGFWIEGGIHAREWISPATVLFMAGQMLENYKKDPDLTAMVDMFDWYVLPVTNPDGYVYTWKNSKARLWRKTRSKQGKCYGVDPNRNWDIQWCKTGASKDPCSETYCGPKAFSEVEVRGVANFMSNIKNLRGFIDFHSYSQLWMSPWGYTKTLPKDFKEEDIGAAAAVNALSKLYGTKYEHGSIANIIYVSSGSSADWTYGKLGIEYSYGVELRDTGKYGFLLPEDQILPTGQETLNALIALAKFVSQS